VHTRSVLAVGAVLWYSPASQSAVTFAQAAPLLEKVVPLSHAAHWRFAEALGAEVSPSPAGQVDHGVQEVFASASGSYWPLGHSAHTRLDEAVAAALVYLPTGHELATVAQASPESASENVVPLEHEVHPRGAVALGAVDCPYPTGHVCHAVQVVAPAALKCAEAHAVQVVAPDAL
jgi:hypothetical protein